MSTASLVFVAMAISLSKVFYVGRRKRVHMDLTSAVMTVLLAIVFIGEL